jgi:hypothetical protein
MCCPSFSILLLFLLAGAFLQWPDLGQSYWETRMQGACGTAPMIQNFIEESLIEKRLLDEII